MRNNEPIKGASGPIETAVDRMPAVLHGGSAVQTFDRVERSPGIPSDTVDKVLVSAPLAAESTNTRLISSVYVVMIHLRGTFEHTNQVSKWIGSFYDAFFNEKLIKSLA
jgi:hypothetical protein